MGLAPRFQREKLRFQQKNAKLVRLAPRILGTRVLKNTENQRFKTGAGSQLFDNVVFNSKILFSHRMFLWN